MFIKSNDSKTIQAEMRFLARVCREVLLLVVVSCLLGWVAAFVTDTSAVLDGVAAFLILTPALGALYEIFGELMCKLLHTPPRCEKVTVTKLFEAHLVIPDRAIPPLYQPPRRFI